VVKNPSTSFAAINKIDTQTGITWYLYKQQNLITEVNNACPIFCSNAINFNKQNAEMVRETSVEVACSYCRRKTKMHVITRLLYYCLYHSTLVEQVEKTFIALEGMNTFVFEQHQLLSTVSLILSNREL
jgi:hypothetical protein